MRPRKQLSNESPPRVPFGSAPVKDTPERPIDESEISGAVAAPVDRPIGPRKRKMPTQHTTYSGILGALRRLRDALNTNSDNLDYLEGGRAKLDKLLQDLEEAVSQQASLIAAKQETSKRVKELIRQGKRLASVMHAALKEHYGIRSEKLAEFGLQPFRGRARKAPESEAPEVNGEAPKPTGSTDSRS